MNKLKAFIKKYPEYRLEALELLYNGDDALDIYNYLNNRRLAKLNDKLLTEMGI
jgi:hypothetical protein